MKLRGLFFLLMFLCALALWLVPVQAGAQKDDAVAPPPGDAVVLQIKGAIGPATYDYISRELKEAEEREAAILILEMDTPGGLFSSTRDIISAILASPVPVATYVSPGGAHAASAGTYILYASHVAAMAPGTNLGAATPINMDGSGGLDQKKEKKEGEADRKDTSAISSKMINDAAAYIRGLAEERGRNAEWAEEAVREAKSLTYSEALEKNVIDFVATDIPALLAAANGKEVKINNLMTKLQTAGAEIVQSPPDWRTKFLSIITDPNIALLLMTLGAYGLIYEFANPGAFVPGVIGVICLTVGLFAMNVLPVNYAGLILIFLGMAFMVSEAFVPSFGVLGIGGAVAFAIGAAILIDTDVPEFQISPVTIIGVTGLSLGMLAFVLGIVVRSTRGDVTTGQEAMVGSDVEVVDWQGDAGHVRYGGELWNAQSREKKKFKPGAKVCVLEMKGLKLVVGEEPETESKERG